MKAVVKSEAARLRGEGKGRDCVTLRWKAVVVNKIGNRHGVGVGGSEGNQGRRQRDM